MPAETRPDAPPRRHGRGCGYEHQAELLAANRALGAALHKLARDPDPAARSVGATIAAAMADLAGKAATVAAESTSVARRHADQVARRLPRLLAEVDRCRAQLDQQRRGQP